MATNGGVSSIIGLQKIHIFYVTKMITFIINKQESIPEGCQPPACHQYMLHNEPVWTMSACPGGEGGRAKGTGTGARGGSLYDEFRCIMGKGHMGYPPVNRITYPPPKKPDIFSNSSIMLFLSQSSFCERLVRWCKDSMEDSGTFWIAPQIP